MKAFPGGDHREFGGSDRYLDLLPTAGGPPVYGSSSPTLEESPGSDRIKVLSLVRRYWLLLLTIMLLGAAGGIVSVVLDSPVYQAHVMIEIQGINEAFLKNSLDVSSTYDSNEVNIQTHIQLLRTGPFLRRVFERLQSETVPLAPAGADIFSRLRQRLRPSVQNPMENVRQGLQVALATFNARPINRTRLIELNCDSTSPDIAAQFVNTMATEFIEETLRSRMQSSQKTSEWLSAQIEETKTKLQDSEERLRDFVRSSNNLFVSQETRLDDAKLNQLRAELSRIQAERIQRQIKYESTVKSPPELLPEVLDDPTLRGYQQRINELRRERAALETTFTSEHPKMKKVDAQLQVVQSSFQSERMGVVSRIKNDYETALQQERTLSSAYNAQSQRVSGMAGQASEHNALRREVETVRQIYQSLLMQSNQAGLFSSVPVNPVRLIELSTPAREPYKPRPVLNISFGVVLGLAVTAGLVFIREKSDSSVKQPGLSRILLNTTELGVIPSAGLGRNGGLLSRFRRKQSEELSVVGVNRNKEVAFWRDDYSILAESFRGTLASLLWDQGINAPRVILITSAGQGEGKTMVAANLAIALAETGRRVLVVDTDFRRPRLHEVFQIPNERGLVDLLTEQIPPGKYSQELIGIATRIPGLTLLPNRAARQSVSRLLYSPRLPALIVRFRELYDIVLIDAPPILDLADARIVARSTDGVILVLRSGMTDRSRALEAYQRICEDGLRLFGTVLNDWNPGKAHLKRQYYYSYADKDNDEST